jgi:hypothetical protein
MLWLQYSAPYTCARTFPSRPRHGARIAIKRGPFLPIYFHHLFFATAERRTIQQATAEGVLFLITTTNVNK